MIIDVTLQENEQSFDVDFGEVQNISDGGYERGYAAGVASVPDYLELRLQNQLTEYTNETITVVNNYCFYGATNLKAIHLPNLETIKQNAFYNCTGLKKCVFQSVTVAEGYAFRACTGLSELDFWNLQRIETNCFLTCTSLAKLIIRTNTVCVLNTSAPFDGSPIKKGTGYIYVPDNLVDSYKKATNWSTYASQIKPLSELGE